MSEEQPVFKVTDRRLFNPDGTPRDIPHEEEAKTQPTGEAEEPSSIGGQQASSTSVGEGTAQRRAAQSTPVEQDHVEAAPSHSHEEDYAESDIPGADDPASFVNFLMSIASNAAASLGMMEHPVTGERRVDPELAKHWIDILGMLKEKTRGNLAPQEQQIFDGLLADLRMQYVSLTSSGRQPKPSRGFKGSDITGGR
ncbi:MAG TPA: DUF1844 domain-containing protein [Pyrinomonadaceae bacterium]|nr:DUF1844 domain-containing protein [Pyrinomonadaceae bacterium]